MVNLRDKFVSWLKLSAGAVSRDKVLQEKLKVDYQKVMGLAFDFGCNKCFDKQYNNFYNKILTMGTTTQSAYKLKRMFNGISFQGVIYNNADMTDKQGKFLLKNHPAKESLFEVIPKKEPTKKTKTKEVDSLNIEETK